MSLLPILLFFVFANCVFSVETDVSVFVGDSFTLHTNLPQIETNAVIYWTFREIHIVTISNENNKNIMNYNYQRDGMKVDNQTGDLTIKNIRPTDSGRYKLEIQSSQESSKIFNVTCVIDDGVKVVSVLDGDSVVLPTGPNKISRDDQIILRFEDNVITRIIQSSGTLNGHILDERFQKRLRLIPETGSLIITNVRTEISGFYELNVTKISRGFTIHKVFNVTAVDSGNKLTVMEGSSVTLKLGIDEIHRDDVITWRFEHEDSVIVNISNGSFTTSDGADGRFRERLELDDKTGSLTIRNIKTAHAGIYHLDITGKQHTVFKKVSLSVCPSIWSLHFYAGICISFLLGFTVAVALIFCGKKMCRRKERGCDVCRYIKETPSPTTFEKNTKTYI